MAGIGHNQRPVVTLESLSSADKDTLKNCIEVLNDSFTRIAAERDLQKQALADLYEELGIDKRLVRRLAKVYNKANFAEEVEADDTFEEFYEAILKK